jgi:hypothetical protein
MSTTAIFPHTQVFLVFSSEAFSVIYSKLAYMYAKRKTKKKERE